MYRGTFEPTPRGGGSLRASDANYRARPDDPQIPQNLAKELELAGGEDIEAEPGSAGPRRGGPQGPLVQRIIRVNGRTPQEFLERKRFADLTAIDPKVKIKFEIPGGSVSMRVVDLMTPIGLGQRGLIVAPPRTGKTILLQQMAAGLAANHPDVYMLVLLIDERPEEVTEMRRTVRGEVVASSNDQDIASHMRIARLMIAKAKRMVECGRHVFVLLDSLTRLGRAFNAGIQSSSRIMSGGLDIRALEEPKQIFGAARNVEGGGSLTIVASALIETGSRMDEVIFNEFKGTGNMEIVLTRELANRRIWPAINLEQSGTRKEELLLGPVNTQKVYRIRRQLAGQDSAKAMDMLLTLLGHYKDNESMLAGLPG